MREQIIIALVWLAAIVAVYLAAMAIIYAFGWAATPGNLR